MTSKYERLDAAINQRRIDLDMGWKDLASAARMADVTLRNIRSGRNNPSDLNKRRLEDALRWNPGSIDAIITGGDPTPIEDTDSQSSMSEEAKSTLAIIDSLEQQLEELRARIEDGEERRGKSA